MVIGVREVELHAGVGAWFTGRHVGDVMDANLAHHRPHTPDRLRAARDAVGVATATDPACWNLMRQVHGARVGVVDHHTVAGEEFRDVDVLVTDLPGRTLVVLAADCLPLVAVGRTAVGVAHAGWRGLVEDVPGALVGALVGLGERTQDLRIAIGPAIGPCCYEVGDEVVDALSEGPGGPVATTRTTWGTRSVDLRAAARSRLAGLGVAVILDAGGEAVGQPVCTACTTGWWSHRRDATAGRHAGLVVRRQRAEEPV
jgi:YfiH family protein